MTHMIFTLPNRGIIEKWPTIMCYLFFFFTTSCSSSSSSSSSSSLENVPLIEIEGDLILKREIDVNKDLFQFDRFAVNSGSSEVVLVGSRDGVYRYDLSTDEFEKIIESGVGPDKAKISLFTQPVIFEDYVLLFDRTPQGKVSIVKNGAVQISYSYIDDLGGITPFIGSSFLIQSVDKKNGSVSVLISCSTNPPQVSGFINETTLASVSIGLDSSFSTLNWVSTPLSDNLTAVKADEERVEYQAFIAPYLVARGSDVFLKFSFDYDVYKCSSFDKHSEKYISFSKLYYPFRFRRNLDEGTKEGKYKMFYSNLFVEGFGDFNGNLAIVYTQTVDPDLAPSNKTQAREFIKSGRVIHFYDEKTDAEKIFRIPDFVSGTNFIFYEDMIIFMSQDNAVDGKMLYLFKNPIA